MTGQQALFSMIVAQLAGMGMFEGGAQGWGLGCNGALWQSIPSKHCPQATVLASSATI